MCQTLLQCNRIEGYDPGQGGLYERKVVDVRTESDEVIRAYTYYQNFTPQQITETSDRLTAYPEGDWSISTDFPGVTGHQDL